MKRILLLTVLVIIAALSYGCSNSPKRVTFLPGSAPGPKSGETVSTLESPDDKGLTVSDEPSVGRSEQLTGNSLALPETTNLSDFARDEEMFRGNAVYFEYDRSALSLDELPKVEPVGEFLKSNPSARLLIEGHCDERGTEEYNRSLGERRALTLREYLINLGISGSRVITQSWGEDRSVEPGHDEHSWSRNRRGEFVILKPRTLASR